MDRCTEIDMDLYVCVHEFTHIYLLALSSERANDIPVVLSPHSTQILPSVILKKKKKSQPLKPTRAPEEMADFRAQKPQD